MGKKRSVRQAYWMVLGAAATATTGGVTLTASETATTAVNETAVITEVTILRLPPLPPP